jgi:hypothetical protein
VQRNSSNSITEADRILLISPSSTSDSVSFSDGHYRVEASLDAFAQRASVIACERFDGLYPPGVPGDKSLHILGQITACNLKEALGRSWAARMPAEGTFLDAIAKYQVGDTTVGKSVVRIEVTARFGKPYPLHLYNPRTGLPETQLDIDETTFKAETTVEHGTWNGGLGRFEAKTTYTGAQEPESGLDIEITFSDNGHDVYSMRR